MTLSYHGKLFAIAMIITIMLLIIVTREKKHIKIDTEYFDGTLVLFCYADWCAHCKLIKQKFIELMKRQPISGVKFDMVEESEPKYKEYTHIIPGYPTLVVDDGKITKTFVGGNKVSEALKKFINYSN